ncbi:hypothetical protein Mag101_07375 [Microbulbifer agarilyticus]|uniref:Terminase n=1 Tax=Microbulbifer agarilyticus TaxID=260552 RepID=A0A1Q2M497_9GAMM|nr:phage terminase small subunit P27 family [Microbulbifer agarilyticus]AQQ67479.1 hypothetical protein Mag101_07375 [Microbulbifer agarilyticus]
MTSQTPVKSAAIIPLKTGSVVPGESSDSSGMFQGVKTERPTKPRWLSKEAGRHWDYIVKELENANLISKLDQGALSILCTSYARMKEAEEEVANKGEFQSTPSGYQQLAPWAVSWERHQKNYLKVASQYGLTVRARQQVKVSDPNQGELNL